MQKFKEKQELSDLYTVPIYGEMDDVLIYRMFSKQGYNMAKYIEKIYCTHEGIITCFFCHILMFLIDTLDYIIFKFQKNRKE